MTTIALMWYYGAMTLDEVILEYLHEEEKARQVKQITADLNEKKDLNTSDGYVAAVLNKLKKQGLVKVSTHRGWWSLTEKGIARATGTDFKEPFFSKAEVNSSVILRGISNFKDQVKTNSEHIHEEILEFFVGMYIVKHDLELPVGMSLSTVEADYLTNLVGRINNALKEFEPSRF